MCKQKRPSTLADRMEDQSKGIVSQVDPETEKYFAEMAKRLGITVKENKEEQEEIE